MKKFLLTTIVATLFFAASLYIGNTQVGKAPTSTFKRKEHHVSVSSLDKFPELIKNYQDAKKQPENLTLWKELSSTLRVAYETERKKGNDARELAFFYLESLLHIVEKEPHNKEALLALADISFERKVFSKAAEYYETYLKDSKEDHNVRARLASAYTFLGKFDRAIDELNSVLAVKPEHFQSLAYKTIALAQTNRKKEALKVGEQALDHAPTPEAKKRFASYLQTLEKKGSQSQIERYLRTNEVTASKFQSLEKKEGVLQVLFKDFPMSAMPPVAREKFFSRIKEYLDEDVQKVVFLDASSGEVLDVLELS